jgi:hypothetical protein
MKALPLRKVRDRWRTLSAHQDLERFISNHCLPWMRSVSGIFGIGHGELCDISGGGWVDIDLLSDAIATGDADGKVTCEYAVEIAQIGDPGNIAAALFEIKNRVAPERSEANKTPLDQLTIRGMAEQFADLFSSRLESPGHFGPSFSALRE